jgi:hypothetical protein
MLLAAWFCINGVRDSLRQQYTHSESDRVQLLKKTIWSVLDTGVVYSSLIISPFCIFPMVLTVLVSLPGPLQRLDEILWVLGL